MIPQQNQASTTGKCLKDKLADAEAKAKAAEFHKQTAATLNDLIKKSEKELETYRNAQPGLAANWQEQASLITDMQKHIESCYPNWKCILDTAVCTEVICPNQEKKADYESRLGGPELALEQANATLASAKEQLEAWKDISKWLGKRLEDNKKLFDRICSLDDCKNPFLQLYLFYFVLLPQHCQIAVGSTKPEGCQPAACACQTADDNNLAGFPWIIPSDQYDCQLTSVWETWCSAGEAQSAAQSKFEQTAKLRKEYQDASTADAIEKAAAEALRKYNALDPKPCGNGSGKPGQEPEPGCDGEQEQQPQQQNPKQYPKQDYEDGESVNLGM